MTDGTLTLACTIPASSPLGKALAAGGEAGTLELEQVTLAGVIKRPGNNVHFALPVVAKIAGLVLPKGD
jgi:hypothetical protein